MRIVGEAEAEAIEEAEAEAIEEAEAGVGAIRAEETAIEKAGLSDFSSSRSDFRTLASFSRPS